MINLLLFKDNLGAKIGIFYKKGGQKPPFFVETTLRIKKNPYLCAKLSLNNNKLIILIINQTHSK